MALFERHAWPGNIRQLANVLRTAAAMASGEVEITQEHLSDDFLEDVEAVHAAVSTVSTVSTEATIRRTLGETELSLIHSTIEAARGNISAAARQLGISQEHDLSPAAPGDLTRSGSHARGHASRTQGRHAALDLRLRRPQRQSHVAGHFLVGEPLDEGQGDGLALPLAQLAQHRMQPARPPCALDDRFRPRSVDILAQVERVLAEQLLMPGAADVPSQRVERTTSRDDEPAIPEAFHARC